MEEPVTKLKQGTEKDELMQSSSNALIRIQHEKEACKLKSLSRHNPEKVAKILYLHALGCSQTNMIRRHSMFRDLKEISIAKANSQRQAMTARGEASQVVDVNNTYTIEDFNDTLSAARKRIEKLKEDAIDAEEVEDAQ
jgi:hypothetical protein